MNILKAFGIFLTGGMTLFSLVGCGPTPSPDLFITIETPVVDAGIREITISYTVSNLGEWEALAFAVDVWGHRDMAPGAGDVSDATSATLGPLASGSTLTGSLTFVSDLLTGTAYGAVDVTDTIAETDETNNVSVARDWIAALADVTAPPTVEDAYENGGTDNLPVGASILAVGMGVAESQRRTLFPLGDVDYSKITLVAGTAYELSTSHLNYTGDTFIYLYSHDPNLPLTEANLVEISFNDDYNGFASRILYTPLVSGDYYVKVLDYNVVVATPGLRAIAYNVTLRIFTDGDLDTQSPFYDCDDNNNAVFTVTYGFSEIQGDGIDNNCSGTDYMLASTVDAVDQNAGDNTIAKAQPLSRTLGFVGATHLRHEVYMNNSRTISPVGDVDWFSVILKPYELMEFQFIQNLTGMGFQVFKADGTELTLGRTAWFTLRNAPAVANAPVLYPPEVFPETYYIMVTGDITWTTGFYVLSGGSLGVDKDLDGNGDEGWARDCNDSDWNIKPGAVEAVDTVDSNCNLLDGS